MSSTMAARTTCVLTVEDKNESRAKKDNALCKSMKPIVLMLKIFGTFPYKISPTGEMVFKACSLTTAYSCLIQILVSAGVGYLYISRFYMDKYQDGRLISRLSKCLTILMNAQPIIVPITHWPETWKKIKLFNKWTEFQNNFSIVTGRTLDLGSGRWMWLALFILNAYIIYADIINQHNMKSISILEHCMEIVIFHVSIHLLFLTSIFWVCYCSLVTKTANLLLTDIKEFVSDNGFENGERLAKYRFLWIQLSDLTQRFGNSMGVSLGCNILTVLTTQIIYIYCFLNYASRGYVPTGIKIIVIVAAILIFIQCNVSHVTTHAVGVKFQKLLQNLEFKNKITNTAADTEVQKFMSAISSNPPVISLCGFASVNRELLSTFVSVLVTYIVVLLQFRMSMTDPRPSNNATSASSEEEN